MNLEFRVLERDVTGLFVSHDCQLVEGYFKTINSIHPERNFQPIKGSPGDAKTQDVYKSRLKNALEKIIPLNASTINDLWSSVSLNVPGTIIFEGEKVPEQICKDLPRIQYLVLDGFHIYSNQPPIQNACEKLLHSLKPLTLSFEALCRLATLLTQSSLDNIFLYINDYFSQPQLGFNAVNHTFSTIYIQSKPLSIRICRLFKLISIADGESIGYIKGERVYILNNADLISGIARTSKVFDCISPFFESLNDAIAFSWREKPSICLVS